MLVLISILVILSGHTVIGPKVLMTVLKNGCFTNSTFAMAPIYDISKWQEQNRFLDAYESFTESRPVNFINNKWVRKNSFFSHPIDHLITDKRWEEFQTVFTRVVSLFNHILHFAVLATFDRSTNFTIPFSVFAEQEAHAFLCENRKVSKSRCYWFMLDAWDGTKSAFRECLLGEISERHVTPASSGDCFESTHYFKQGEKLLTPGRWRHYKIVMSGSFMQLINEKGEDVLGGKVLKLSFQPRHFIVHTKRVNGLWKVHNFNYLYSTETGVSRFRLDYSYNYKCLSMMVALCVNCQMRLTIDHYELLGTLSGYSKNNKWFHYINCFESQGTVLTVDRLIHGRSDDAYWALDKIEMVEEPDKETRVLKPKQNYWTNSCQILSSNLILSLNNPNIRVLENWAKCEVKELGEDCTPCHYLFDLYCQEPSKYCQLVEQSNGTITNGCYCPPGYEGEYCKKTCSGQYSYGHGCQNCCDGCTNGCSNYRVTGKCNTVSCKDNRFGPKCDKINGFYWFKHPPIMRPGRTSCNISMTSLDGYGDRTSIQHLVILYQSTSMETWRARWVPFDISSTVTLTELLRDTTYHVRVLGLANLEYLDYVKVPKHYVTAELTEYNFTTGCNKDLDANQLAVLASSHSVTVTINNTARIDYDYCTLNDYQVSVNGTGVTWKWQIDNLEPYSKYELTLERENQKITKIFYTTESKKENSLYMYNGKTEPQEPYGLKTEWTENNQLILTWRHPSKTNGILRQFVIRINDLEFNYDLLRGVEDYRFSYTKMIDGEKMELASFLTVLVTAKNSHSESEPAMLRINSPPPIPEDDVDVTTRNATTVAVWKNKNLKEAFTRFVYVFTTICRNCDNEIATKDLSRTTNTPNWNLFYYSQIDENIYIELPASTVKVTFVWMHQYKEHKRYKYFIHSVHPSGGNDKVEKVSYALLWFAAAFLLVATLVIFALYSTNRWNRRSDNNVSVTQRLTDWIARFGNVATSITRAVKVREDDNGSTYDCNVMNLNIPVMAKRDVSFPDRNSLFKTAHSRLVKLQDFSDYFRRSIGDELQRQHEIISSGPTHPALYGELPQNQKKNRYWDMVAYDHSRVVLEKIQGDNYSDYINASYIDGYKQPRAYIATQGPKPNTILDFWRMVWQEGATHIVVVANLIEDNKKKFEKYWPDSGKEAIYKAYKVTFVKSEENSMYVHRVFQLTHRDLEESRLIHQYHYQTWPDYGVPANPQTLLPLFKQLLAMRSQDFPLIVHCSAGVGRTGTIILCDICLRMAAYEGYVDVLAVFEYLRSRRCNMVVNVEQYRLAHLIILHCLTGDKMSIDMPISGTFKSDIQQLPEIDYIDKCQWEDDAMVQSRCYDEDLDAY